MRQCDWRHVPCLAHTLNLVVQNALREDDNVHELLTKVKNVVSNFHKSVKASDELRKIQQQLTMPDHKLVQEVETRWNSSCYNAGEIY